MKKKIESLWDKMRKTSEPKKEMPGTLSAKKAAEVKREKRRQRNLKNSLKSVK